MSRHPTQHDPAWRAALLQAIAQGFQYPSAGHAQRLRATLERLVALAPADTPPSLARALRQAQARWRHVAGEALEAEYSRLFLNQAPCPMHETAYGGPGGVAGRTREIADIAGFYLAFGLRAADTETDRPDHLCAELEYLSILLLKWVHADERGWGDKRRITARAARSFLNDHLGRWHSAFSTRLAASDAPPAYRVLAGLLVSAVNAECRAWAARPARVAGEMPRDFMQEDGLVCPKDSAGVAIPASPVKSDEARGNSTRLPDPSRTLGQPSWRGATP